MNNPNIKRLISNRFHLSEVVPEDSELFKDMYQDIELFILEKGYDEEYFFTALRDMDELKKEFDTTIKERYRINRSINNPSEEIDFEMELAKEKNAAFIDEESILKKTYSAIHLDEKENELKGIDVLREILSPIEFEAFIYKVDKTPDYKYDFITGLSNSGIDIFFKTAIQRIKIYQNKEKVSSNKKGIV